MNTASERYAKKGIMQIQLKEYKEDKRICLH